jgi:hypothetical protein
VLDNTVELSQVAPQDNLADALTEPLSHKHFKGFRKGDESPVVHLHLDQQRVDTDILEQL